MNRRNFLDAWTAAAPATCPAVCQRFADLTRLDSPLGLQWRNGRVHTHLRKANAAASRRLAAGRSKGPVPDGGIMDADPMETPIDVPYRREVRAAAGREHLQSMTEQCLGAVEVLATREKATTRKSPELVRELHRLAGGTAAVGLCALASSLRALEKSYAAGSDPAVLQELWARCRGSAQASRAALGSEGS